MMTMHRLAPFLTAAGLILILGVVVLMLTDGLTPGRVAPLAAALGAAGGGVLLVLGLAGLEHGRDRSREWG
jgi:peptidoglycan/LPS O-acetylase OafA/YrhL